MRAGRCVPPGGGPLADRQLAAGRQSDSAPGQIGRGRDDADDERDGDGVTRRQNCREGRYQHHLARADPAGEDD